MLLVKVCEASSEVCTDFANELKFTISAHSECTHDLSERMYSVRMISGQVCAEFGFGGGGDGVFLFILLFSTCALFV